MIYESNAKIRPDRGRLVNDNKLKCTQIGYSDLYFIDSSMISTVQTAETASESVSF